MAASAPAEGEVGGRARLAHRPCFVARSGPPVPRLAPVVGTPRRPFEVAGSQDVRERPARVVVNVGGEAELGTRAHDTGEGPQALIGDESPLALTPFGPGIRIEEIHGVDRARG